MKAEEYNYIMIFTSHQRAMYMYQHLLKKDIKTKLVSAPNKINISCTQALKFKDVNVEIIKQELKKNNIYPTATYKIIGEGKNVTYELVE